MRVRGLNEITMGTLASLTALLSSTKIDANRLNGCRLRKNFYKADWQGKTAGVSEGPIHYGFSYSMTIAKIAAFFAADPQSKVDLIAEAESHEKLLWLGTIGQPSTNSGGTGTGPADSIMRRFTWPFGDIIEGTTFSVFVFNANPGDPLATGMTFQMASQLMGDWLND